MKPQQLSHKLRSVKLYWGKKWIAIATRHGVQKSPDLIYKEVITYLFILTFW